MSENTAIPWAKDTLNPWIGCEKAGPGCENCYAKDYARRFWPSMSAWDGKTHRQPAATMEKHLERLENAKTARIVFCGSMTDLGLVATNDPSGLAAFLSRLFRAQMIRKRKKKAPHVFLWLTKRPRPLARFLASLVFNKETETFKVGEERAGWIKPVESWRFPGLWVGVSTENQETAEARIPPLLQIAMAERLFISAEPLLGALDLEKVKFGYGWINAMTGTVYDVRENPSAQYRKLDWIIAGGESGHHARPTHPHHVEDLKDVALFHHIPFFFKAWGAWAPIEGDALEGIKSPVFAWTSPKGGGMGFMVARSEGKNYPEGITYPLSAKRGGVANDKLFEPGYIREIPERPPC
jgi:protein gp37